MKYKSLSKHFILFSIIFVLFSCNELLFENTMPKKGLIQSKIPTFFDGQWIQIFFNQNGISANLYTIEKRSTSHCIIYKQKLKYLDSISLSKTGIGVLDTVVFKENSLIIIGQDSCLSLNVMNTLESSKLKVEYDINLNQNYFNLNYYTLLIK